MILNPRPRAERLMRRGILCLLALGLAGCTEMIVRDGRPEASIIVAKDAPLEVMRAARELQTYVRKTSGSEITIRNEGESRNERVEIRLAVTPPGVSRGGNPSSAIVHEDGYAIESHGRMITILGGSPRGTLYGVYDFIERVLGVRWFMPTDLGEEIRAQRSIAVPELSLVRNPAFPSVSGFTWAGSPGAEDWELRMRVRVGKPVNFGHNWFNIHPLNKETFAADPEMFALVAGRRGRSTQLCSSYPKVVRVTVEAARRYFAANPEAPLFSISPNDGLGWCECDRCKKIDALYGVTEGSLADRFVHYANEVSAELEKTHPGKQVGIYAYAEHTSPPKKARPGPNYVTALTHMPWAFCHVHAVDDPSCPSNQQYFGFLKGWQALTRHVGIYEYYGHFSVFTPWPIVHSMRRDIPLYKEMGIERFISETQQNWANQGLNFYVAAKLVADPTTDVDALLAEYFARFYGEAGPAMRRYADLWETAMLKTGSRAEHRGYSWLQMFTLPLVAEADLILKEAEERAAADTEMVRKRVAFARSGFGYTEAYAQMIDAGMRKDRAALAQWSAEAEKRLKATEGSAPQAFFVSVAIDQTRYMARILESGVPPWITLKPLP
ncbi:MAG: DUF4838 domain-containing protein [Vicinamibacteria bacterium]|nr:DUF4838 domain-containing protein [Vicinamibacteria bacterium]